MKYLLEVSIILVAMLFLLTREYFAPVPLSIKYPTPIKELPVVRGEYDLSSARNLFSPRSISYIQMEENMPLTSELVDTSKPDNLVIDLSADLIGEPVDWSISPMERSPADSYQKGYDAGFMEASDECFTTHFNDWFKQGFKQGYREAVKSMKK